MLDGSQCNNYEKRKTHQQRAYKIEMVFLYSSCEKKAKKKNRIAYDKAPAVGFCMVTARKEPDAYKYRAENKGGIDRLQQARKHENRDHRCG